MSMPIRFWKKIFLMPRCSSKSQRAYAFSHFSSDFLNRKFLRKFIGKGGPNTWLPRSSHVTPLDFTFWYHIKGAVCVPPLPTTLPEMPGWKRAGAATVTAIMLTNVWKATSIKMSVSGYSRSPH